MDHSRPLFLYFRLSWICNWQLNYIQNILLLMSGFELRISVVVSDRSANCAITTAQCWIKNISPKTERCDWTLAVMRPFDWRWITILRLIFFVRSAPGLEGVFASHLSPFPIKNRLKIVLTPRQIARILFLPYRNRINRPHFINFSRRVCPA